MKNTKTVFKRRKFKRTFQRKLTLRDITVLDFLWTWKVATTSMLKEVAFKSKSQWWIYKALRQLKNERLIQLLPRGKFLDQELWALTESGFEVVLMDRDDIAHYRYKPHAPTHDFLATCLQLGEYWQSDLDREYLTEQMLASLSPSNFPVRIREAKDHVPDGLTLIPNGNSDIIIGYEVDLNLKDEERYEDTLRYYDRYKVNASLVIWLVKNKWLADKILAIIKEHFDTKYSTTNTTYAFVLLEDFKKLVWEAPAINPACKGLTISKLHANLLQSNGKSVPKTQQKNLDSIFFQKYKSPQKLRAYQSQTQMKNYQHPSGPGNKSVHEVCDTEKIKGENLT